MSATNTCGTPIPDPPGVIHISEKVTATHGEQAAKEIVKAIMQNHDRELDYWRHEHIYKEVRHA